MFENLSNALRPGEERIEYVPVPEEWRLLFWSNKGTSFWYNPVTKSGHPISKNNLHHNKGRYYSTREAIDWSFRHLAKIRTRCKCCGNDLNFEFIKNGRRYCSVDCKRNYTLATKQKRALEKARKLLEAAGLQEKASSL